MSEGCLAEAAASAAGDVALPQALRLLEAGRLPLHPGEQPPICGVRFRTLGRYPLTGAIESGAATPSDISAELRSARTSGRRGRLIGSDDGASIERKKRQGHF